jgi:tetratricopeptide (TPR) repeat protein
MSTLPDDVAEAIETLAEQGDALASMGQRAAAINIYQRAISMLPEPRFQWQAFMWFHTAIGDALYLDAQFEAALPHWVSAILSGGLANPFIHMRRGQCLWALGQAQEATNELSRAFLLGGAELFDGEAHCQDHLEHVTALLKPPQGRADWEGWEGFPEGQVPPYFMDASVYGVDKIEAPEA